jgi:phosphoribosylformimino-5-aminoimidazole carboxamide ribotide isomerase
MEILPAIDVLDGRVVRLSQGNFRGVTLYGNDPAAQMRAWAVAGARMVHVVDLDGARSGICDAALIASLAHAGVPFQFGGGIRTAAAAAGAVASGAGRVVMGTAAVWDPAVIDEAVAAVGSEAVVAALDVRDGRAKGGGWLDDGRPADEIAGRLADQGVVRMMVTGIERDGLMGGPDLALLERVRRLAPALAVVASGGVGSLEDLEALAAAGVEAAVVGRALYEGRFTLADAMAAVA